MIVVDMESSGLDPVRDSLLSVGAVEFENPNNQFYEECRIWPGAHVDKQALAVNGFSLEQTTDPQKQTDKDLLLKFLKWAERCVEKTLAGHNPSADRDFLRATAHRYHINWPFAYRTVDLHSICWGIILAKGEKPPQNNEHSALSLDKILNYVGIPDEPRPHNGLRGAKLESEAFSRLLYKKPQLEEYFTHKLPSDA